MTGDGPTTTSSPTKLAVGGGPPPSGAGGPASSSIGENGKEKQKEACVSCRVTKVKCHAVSAEADPHDPCKRCVRLKLDCVYQQKKRGRKVGSGSKRKSDASEVLEQGGALKRKKSTASAGASKRVKTHSPADEEDDDEDDDDDAHSLSSASSSPRAPPQNNTTELARAQGRNDGPGGMASSASGFPHAQTLPGLSVSVPTGSASASSEGWSNASQILPQPHSVQLPRDAWGNFLPANNVRYRDSAFGGGGEASNDPSRPGGLVPSYAADLIGGGGGGMNGYSGGAGGSYGRSPAPEGGLNLADYPYPSQQPHLAAVLNTPTPPLYFGHIQPSWSDHRQASHTLSGGVRIKQDPYGLPPPMPPPAPGSQQPVYLQHVQFQPSSSGPSTFQASNSRNDNQASTANPPPQGSVGAPTTTSSGRSSGHTPGSSTAPTTSMMTVSGGMSTRIDTPPVQTQSLRNLLNAPSPSSTGSQEITRLTTQRRASSSAGGPAQGENRVQSGAITGTIPLSVKDVLTRHSEDEEGSDVGELGAEGEGVEGSAAAAKRAGRRRRESDEGAKGSVGWETPLEMRILSQEDVYELFDFFHSRLNVFVNLLDVALHQPQFVRQTSAILFTTILAIASRYRRPTLYAHLRKLVNGMLGRAFAEGVVELGLVQSLSLLSFWKEADDRGTWRRVGYAIRVALEMDLHQPSQEPLPDNEIEARKVLNCERTFIQLIAFDNTLFLQSTRPRMIPPEYTRHVQRWCFDHPAFFTIADTMLAASIDNQGIFSIIGACRSSPDRLLKGQLFDSADSLYRNWKERWLSDSPRSPLHPSCRTMLTFYRHMMDFEMAVLRLNLQTYGVEPGHDQGILPGEITCFTDSVQAALRTIAYLSADLKEFLPYSQDTVIFGSASIASWLAKNLTQMNEPMKQASLRAMQGAMHLFKSIADGEDAFSYQSQFFRSLLVVSTRKVSASEKARASNAPPPPPSSFAAESSRSHLDPSINGNQVSTPDLFSTITGAGIPMELSPSAMDSSAVAPDASIEDILANYADLFPFDPSAGSNLDGLAPLPPNFSTSFIGSSFPSF